jgi:D-alanyl-D-alanine carboxypeptidase/D-alanyl-D-alanine-endopeptidase (penicillin-binding protein 4)
MPILFCLRLRALLLLVPLTVASLPAAAGAARSSPSATPAQHTLATRIDDWIGQPRFAHASWGIAVVSLDSGRTLYAHRADRLMRPASIAKLFTAALGLATLGPDYRFTTRLLATGPIRHGHLQGDLILRGGGDPTLGTADGADWAQQLAAQASTQGLHQVNGDLIADDSAFSGPPFGAGWEAGDLQSWFAVPSSALSVDENTVRVTVSPGAAAGRPARITLEPAGGIARISGRIDTSAATAAADINLYRAPGSPVLHAFGSIPAAAAPARFRLAMDDPARQAASQLREALARRGIRIEGVVQVRHWPVEDDHRPASARVLGELSSPPLMEILRRGLKRSQNLYLQNLLQAVGVREQALAETPPATFRDSEAWGIHALQELLQQIGIAPGESHIVEGTGLSRRDLVTPRAMVRLLVYLAVQPHAAELRQALPLAGVDGTLAWRMRGTAAAGNVQAKTGSMGGTQSLAGYVTTAGGERLAFAILLDNYRPGPGAPSPAREVDAIAVMLANGARND